MRQSSPTTGKGRQEKRPKEKRKKEKERRTQKSPSRAFYYYLFEFFSPTRPKGKFPFSSSLSVAPLTRSAWQRPCANQCHRFQFQDGKEKKKKLRKVTVFRLPISPWVESRARRHGGANGGNGLQEWMIHANGRTSPIRSCHCVLAVCSDAYRSGSLGLSGVYYYLLSLLLGGHLQSLGLVRQIGCNKCNATFVSS